MAIISSHFAILHPPFCDMNNGCVLTWLIISMRLKSLSIPHLIVSNHALRSLSISL